MIRSLLSAALMICAAQIWAPALAQQAAYVEVQCSAHIVGVGRPAVRHSVAQQSAIDAWDAEARRIHGARTTFTYRTGVGHRSRLSLSCQSRAGRDTCEVRGRACAYVETRTPNTEVAASCDPGYVLGGENIGRPVCAPNAVGSARPVNPVGPVDWYPPRCPPGYGHSSRNMMVCLRIR